MGYIGNQQTEGFSSIPAKQDLTGATGTSLTLSHAVASAEGIDLFINNVRQESGEAYSIGGDGVTVTLTGSVVASDDIYVVYNSLALQTTVPPDASVSTAKIIDASVSTAKIIDGSVTAAKLATSLDMQNITLKGGTTDAISIDSSGYVTFPVNTVSFLATALANNTSNGNLVFLNLQHNLGSCYSASTGEFTAPIKGIYHFAASVLRNTGDANLSFKVDNALTYLTGNSSQDQAAQYLTATNLSHASISINLQLNAGQKVTAFVGSNVTVYSNYNYFTGHLIGPVS